MKIGRAEQEIVRSEGGKNVKKITRSSTLLFSLMLLALALGQAGEVAKAVGELAGGKW